MSASACSKPIAPDMYAAQAAYGGSDSETLPDDVVARADDPAAPDGGAALLPAWFPGDLRLTIIQAKAQVQLYSHEALRKPDAELLRDIRELDTELHAWRESVPPLFRPTWVHSRHLPTSQHLSIVILRLLFYHILALIHRASSRCSAWAADMRPRWDTEALGSSLALSVEASRSSLLYMRNVASKLANTFTTMILIFPMTSFLVLFSNLLLNPCAEQAASDLALLEQLPDAIKEMRFRHHSPRELGHVRLVYEFVSELVRLGKAAVAKAEREGRVVDTAR